MVLTLLLVKNTPPGVTVHDPAISLRETLASVKTI